MGLAQLAHFTPQCPAALAFLGGQTRPRRRLLCRGSVLSQVGTPGKPGAVYSQPPACLIARLMRDAGMVGGKVWTHDLAVPKLPEMVRAVGIEPTLLAEPDFESGASTSSTTPANQTGIDRQPDATDVALLTRG